MSLVLQRSKLSPVFSTVTASLLGVLLLTSCIEGATESTTSDATLVYATGDAEPTCLDPHVGGNYPQALLATQVLETLVSRSESGEIVPWLATDWNKTADGLTWHFTLNPDALFSDGTPVDAAAIQANIAHLQDPETGSSTGYLAVQQVKSVEVLSATEFNLHLHRPDAALLESLAQPWVAIQSPTAMARGTEENCQEPIGSGPFQVSDWVQQSHVSLTRNPNYHTMPAGLSAPGEAAVGTVMWRFIPDATARFTALQGGDVDIIDNPLPEQITQAEAAENLTHINAPRPGSSNRIELHSAQAPFNDPLVREAFISAIDVNTGIDTLFEGHAARSTSALSSTEPTSVESADTYVTDVDRANKLLDEAGWISFDSDGIRMKNGEKLTARFPITGSQSTQAEQAIFEQIQAQAATVGFDVQISLLDLSSWYGALGAQEYELVSAPYTKIGPDVLRFLYHSDATTPAPSGYFANHAMVQDAELDQLLEQIGTEHDPELRATAAAAAQQRIAELHIILPIYDQQNRFILANSVEGFTVLPTVNTPWLANVELAQ